MLEFILAAIIFGLIIWAVDRQLCLKDVEKDLKLLLGDFLVNRDSDLGPPCYHHQWLISSLKSLIRNHFKE